MHMFPGDVAIQAPGGSEAEVWKALKRFLEQEVPSHMESEAPTHGEGAGMHLVATLFSDFIPIGIEAFFQSEGPDSSTLVLRHFSKNDGVRFHSCSRQIVTYVQTKCPDVVSTLKVGKIAKPSFDDFSDFLDDLSTDDEEPTWQERIAPVVAKLATNSSETREEAVQILARWATGETDSHAAMAKTFATCPDRVWVIFTVTSGMMVAEMYPLAVVLAQLACSGVADARNALRATLELAELDALLATGKLPVIVSNELKRVADALRVDPHSYACLLPVKGGKPHAAPPLSVASTTCTFPSHGMQLIDEEAEDDSEYEATTSDHEGSYPPSRAPSKALSHLLTISDDMWAPLQQ